MSSSCHSLMGAGERQCSAPHSHLGGLLLAGSPPLLEALRIHLFRGRGKVVERIMWAVFMARCEIVTSLCPHPIGQNVIIWPCPAARQSGKCSLLVWPWRKLEPPPPHPASSHFAQALAHALASGPETGKGRAGVGGRRDVAWSGICVWPQPVCRPPSSERVHGGQDP